MSIKISNPISFGLSHRRLAQTLILEIESSSLNFVWNSLTPVLHVSLCGLASWRVAGATLCVTTHSFSLTWKTRIVSMEVPVCTLSQYRYPFRLSESATDSTLHYVSRLPSLRCRVSDVLASVKLGIDWFHKSGLRVLFEENTRKVDNRGWFHPARYLW